MSDGPEEMAPNLLNLPAEAAGELLLGGAQSERGAGSYDVHDRLGLRQVHLAVEKRPSREFARFGRPSFGSQHRLEEARGDEHASMAVELRHVFSRVAARRTKNDSHSFVQFAFLVPKAAEMQHSLEKRAALDLLARKAARQSRSPAARKCELRRWLPRREASRWQRWCPRQARQVPAVSARPVLQQSVGIQAPQLRDKAPVLIHCSDRNSNPFRQLVASHRADDQAAAKKRLKDLVAVAHPHQDEIRCARDKLETHRGKLGLQELATLMRELTGLLHVFLVVNSCQRAGLRDAVCVERLTRLLQHVSNLA